MAPVVLIRRPVAAPEQHWVCPNCDATEVTHIDRAKVRPGEVAQPFHQCRGLFGVGVPMVEDRTRAKVVLIDREDYVGNETVQVDGRGRPLMAAVTTRDDGEDRTVFAPCAMVGRDDPAMDTLRLREMLERHQAGMSIDDLVAEYRRD